MVKHDCTMPLFFHRLIGENLIHADDILCTGDGFLLLYRSLSSLLHSRGIHTFPDREGHILECSNFFDDWFLFALADQKDPVYGLLKMREQEQDLDLGIPADGDTPGVTVSFIAFSTDALERCLKDPSPENRQRLGMEINRTVAYPGQTHHPALKAYFLRPQAEAPYLIAETYTAHIAAFSTAGTLPVPVAYGQIYQKRAASKRYARIPDFLEQNNRQANAVVCDHRHIFLRDPKHLTRQEKLAILATHTGNTSAHSFAAEIRYHALFLTPLAKLRLPLVGSPYASAVRADLSIGDKEFQGPTPYYDHSGRLIREQAKHHRDL